MAFSPPPSQNEIVFLVSYFDLLMVRLSFFSSCFMRATAWACLAAVSLWATSLRTFSCSASITCERQTQPINILAAQNRVVEAWMLTLCVAWLSISCQAESNCRRSSSPRRCSASEMVSLAARRTSEARWKSCVAFWASSWAWSGQTGNVSRRIQTAFLKRYFWMPLLFWRVGSPN